MPLNKESKPTHYNRIHSELNDKTNCRAIYGLYTSVWDNVYSECELYQHNVAEKIDIVGSNYYINWFKITSIK